MKREYPYNLLDKAFGEQYITEPLTSDQAAGLEFVIDTFNKRAQQVITYKYCLNLPTKVIAIALDVSQQAVANTNRKIIEKLQQPQNAVKIKFGLSGAADVSDDSLENLGLSIRTYNALRRGGIAKISDIKSVRQLQKIRQIGETAEEEVLDKLVKRSITLPVNIYEEKLKKKTISGV